MRRLAALVDALETGPAGADAALAHYWAQAPAADAAWGLFLLAGGRLPLRVPATLLRSSACAAAGVDDWLFDACLQAAGDLAETIAQVLPPPAHAGDLGLACWVEQRLLHWRGLPADELGSRLRQAWDELHPPERYLLVKLVGGRWQSGVNRLQLQRSLAQHAGLASGCIAQRLANLDEAAEAVGAQRFQQLLAPETAAEAARRALDFSPVQVVAQGLPDAIAAGPPDRWHVLGQFDGLRVQLVRRDGGCWIWSADDQLLSGCLPELAAAALALPEDTVLEGNLLLWPAGQALPSPLSALAARLAQSPATRRRQPGNLPVFVAVDLHEQGGQDVRALPLHDRWRRMQALLEQQRRGVDGLLRLPLRLDAADASGLAVLHAQARDRGFSGLLLRMQGAAVAGTVGADGTQGGSPADRAWAWPLAPLSVAAVLVQVRSGGGRPGQPGDEYGLALWSRPPVDAAEARDVVDAIAAQRPAQPGSLQLLPVARTAAALDAVDPAVLGQAVRDHRVQRFGPVHSLRPTLVIELAFDGADPSPRHKCGWVLRQPRLLRLRPDLALHQADSVSALQGGGSRRL